MKKTLTLLFLAVFVSLQYASQAQISKSSDLIKQKADKNEIEKAQNLQHQLDKDKLPTQAGSRVTPPDDFCSGATLIPSITSVVCGSTVGYTEDLPTGGQGCNGGEADEQDASKWYTFIGTGSNIDIYVPTTEIDPELNIYTNNCATPVCVTGDDDGGSGLDAHVNFATVCGQVYYMHIHDCCAGSGSFCFTMTVEPGCNSLSYCPSSGSGAAGNKFIKQVKLTASPSNAVLINNISGNNGGYGDFTSTSANVTANSQYKLSLYPSLLPSNNPIFRWKVWIDYNLDGDFNDAGENVASVSANGNASTPNFTIPAAAMTGQDLRMRVSMKMGTQYATSCETGFNGEVEDYTIRVGGAASLVAASNSPWGIYDQSSELISANLDGFSIAPNPSNGQFSIYLRQALQIETTMQVVNSKGQLIHSQLMPPNGALNVSYDGPGLPDGLYFVKIYNAQSVAITQKLVVNH